VIKRIVAILATLAVIGLIVSSGPSNAATPHATTVAGHQLELQEHPAFVLMSSGQCQDYQYCIWVNSNYGGDFYAFQQPYWDYKCITVGAPFKNAVSSAWNRGHSLVMTLWSQTGCGGWWNYRLFAQEPAPNLSGSGMNDETESIKTALT
jgi:hypothetical protein